MQSSSIKMILNLTLSSGLEPSKDWYQCHPGFRSSGIRAGLTGIAGVECKMEKTPKQAWLNELQEINQSIQEENVELKKML
jgi:hypothetical protein